jgi:hypothetical protein
VRQRAIVRVGDNHLADQCAERRACLDNGPTAFRVSRFRSGHSTQQAGEECTQTVNVRGAARSRAPQGLRRLTGRIKRQDQCVPPGRVDLGPREVELGAAAPVQPDLAGLDAAVDQSQRMGGCHGTCEQMDEGQDLRLAQRAAFTNHIGQGAFPCALPDHVRRIVFQRQFDDPDHSGMRVGGGDV